MEVIPYILKVRFICVLKLYSLEDHSFGLPGFLASLSLTATTGEKKKVKVVGPTGLKKMIDTNLELSQTYLTYALDVVELEPERVHDLGEVEGLRLVAAPLKHKTPCFGYVLTEAERPASLNVQKAQKLAGETKLNGKVFASLKEGKDVTLENGVTLHAEEVLDKKPSKKLVLLGDTCESSPIIPFATGCDLLIHEATLDSSQEGSYSFFFRDFGIIFFSPFFLVEKAIERGHSTPKMAGLFANQIGAKNLILTHFSPRYDVQNKPEDLSINDLQKEAEKVVGEATKVFAARDFDTFNFVSEVLEFEKSTGAQN